MNKVSLISLLFCMSICKLMIGQASISGSFEFNIALPRYNIEAQYNLYKRSTHDRKFTELRAVQSKARYILKITGRSSYILDPQFPDLMVEEVVYENNAIVGRNYHLISYRGNGDQNNIFPSIQLDATFASQYIEPLNIENGAIEIIVNACKTPHCEAMVLSLSKEDNPWSLIRIEKF